MSSQLIRRHERVLQSSAYLSKKVPVSKAPTSSSVSCLEGSARAFFFFSGKGLQQNKWLQCHALVFLFSSVSRLSPDGDSSLHFHSFSSSDLNESINSPSIHSRTLLRPLPLPPPPPSPPQKKKGATTPAQPASPGSKRRRELIATCHDCCSTFLQRSGEWIEGSID